MSFSQEPSKTYTMTVREHDVCEAIASAPTDPHSLLGRSDKTRGHDHSEECTFGQVALETLAVLTKDHDAYSSEASALRPAVTKRVEFTKQTRQGG